jgi:hypothetical protein
MSTYGKKALIDWNYSEVDVSRFLKSPKNLQLEILQKWYPLGESCHYVVDKVVRHVDCFIESYAEHSDFYTIILTVDDNLGIGRLNTNIGRLSMHKN